MLMMLSLASLGIPSAVSAHALGASLEATSSPYLIDIGYDPSAITTDRATRFEFELRNTADRRLLSYSDVWVRLRHNDVTILATGIHYQTLGPTTLLYEFPAVGAYELIVSYREGLEEIANASFPISVSGSSSRARFSDMRIIAALAVGFGIFTTAAAFLWRRTRR